MPGPMTMDVIVDRVRSVCIGAPFLFKEAESWSSFDLQPSTNDDLIFRVPPPSSQFVTGGFAFAEDRRDSMQIWVARRRNGNYDSVRRALLRDVHSLTSAITRDALVTSGDYDIPDGGRGHAITDEPGKEYATLRLTLPINYEAQL